MTVNKSTGSKEGLALEELRGGASEAGHRLFRRNVGKAWVATGPEKTSVVQVTRSGPIHVNAGDVVLRKARRFIAGKEGQADLQGWAQVTITPDMVGMTVPIAAEVEVKDKGRASAAQQMWIDMCRRHGVIAGVCRNIQDFKDLIATTYGSRK